MEGDQYSSITHIVSEKPFQPERETLIADTYEAAARTKRTLLQTRKVIERLHEEMTGETISRVTTRSRIMDWLATKKPEIASTSLSFYQNSLGKFLDFLGRPSARSLRRTSSRSETGS